MNTNFLLTPGPGSPFLSRNEQLIQAAQQLGAVPDQGIPQSGIAPIVPVQGVPTLPDGTLISDDPNAGYSAPQTQQRSAQSQPVSQETTQQQPVINMVTPPPVDTGSSGMTQIMTFLGGGPKALAKLWGEDEQRAEANRLAQALDNGTLNSQQILSASPDTRAALNLAYNMKQGGQKQYAPQSDAGKISYDRQQGLITDEQANSMLAQLTNKQVGGQAPSGYRYNADGTLSAITGGPADPALKDKTTKALSDTKTKVLSGLYDNYSQTDRFLSTLDPTYGGAKLESIGDTQNWIARNFSDQNSPDFKQAQWWQDYQGFKNQVRNELFGAALTPGEKAEFDKATINPGMSNATIKTNLERQRSIYQSALGRQARANEAAGYNPEQISELIGNEDYKSFPIYKGAVQQDGSANQPQQNNRPQLSPAQAAAIRAQRQGGR